MTIGRPKIKVDESMVEKLAGMFLTNDEIASVLNCSHDTLTRRFACALKKGKEFGKASIKRAQYISGVKKRNVTMMIWLGKQHLGQRNEPMMEGNDKGQILKWIEDQSNE